MFKYKLSYFFRKKTKLEKHIIHTKVCNDINEGGMRSVIIFMIWSFLSTLFCSLLFLTPTVYNIIAPNYALTELSSFSVTIWGNLSIISGGISGVFVFLLSMLFLLEQINPINLFKYLLTFSSRKYTKKTFSKDMNRLLPLLQKIGFSNKDSQKLVNEYIFNESSYQQKLYSEKFFYCLKKFYMRDNYKKNSEDEENIDIFTTINNFYLQKEVNNPALVQGSTQEQEIIFFSNEKKVA